MRHSFATLTVSFLGALLGSSSIAPAQPRAVTFDPADATNVQELREYASRLWHGIDTGDMPNAMAGFQFSNIPSMWPELAFSDSVELFRHLYADRLVLSFGENSYDLVDLLADDPAVEARFREHTITGTFSTAIDGTDDALQTHLQAIVDALGPQDAFSLNGTCYVQGGELVSQGLAAAVPTVTSIHVDPPQPAQPYREFLDCLLDQPLISCMSEKGLYFPPDGTTLPESRARFDCKSFALVIAAWLRQRGLPATSMKEMSFEWTCVRTNPDGTTSKVTTAHSLIMVTSGDRVYVIDPQSGEILMEFDRSTADPRQIKKAIYDWLVSHGYAGCQPGDEIGIPNPKSYPADFPWWPGTEPAWYVDCALPESDPRKGKEDQDMCYRFKKYLEECCRDQAAGRADCGGGSTGQPAAPAQSPCNESTRYIWN